MTTNKCKCMKCNNSNSSNVRVYTTGTRGYGSKFDTLCNLPVTIYLCDKCSKQVKEEWFIETPTITNEYIQNYLYENEILNFIETLPESSRSLIEDGQYGLDVYC